MLRWKTFEAGTYTKELPQDRIEKLFGMTPTSVTCQKFVMPILQFSHDGVEWHDVPSCDPIPFAMWSAEQQGEQVDVSNK